MQRSYTRFGSKFYACILIITVCLGSRVLPFRSSDAYDRDVIECDAPYDESCCSNSNPCSKKIASIRLALERVPSNSTLTLTLGETFSYLRAGGSLARFGDGEVKALGGRDVRYERTSTELKRALSFVASLGGNPHLSPCLCVGTYPILDGNFSRIRPGKRREFAKNLYKTYISIWNEHMHPGLYCDSFVSRPDAVDDLQYDAVEYFTPQWQSVFEGQKVLLVRGGLPSKPSTLDKTVFSRHLKHAESVSELKSFKSARLHKTVYLSQVSTDSFEEYVGIRNAVLQSLARDKYDVVVLSLGLTASILAAELSCRGFRAVDVGQFGGNFSKP